MKKYLLTSLLLLFGLCTAFVSADSIDGFSSDSDIYKVAFSSNEFGQASDLSNYFNSSLGSDTPIYYCFLTSPSDFYVSVSGNEPVGNVSSSTPCLSSPIVNDDDYFQTLGDFNGDSVVSVNGYVYSSVSPITYSSSSGGGDSGGSLLPGGEGDLSGIISGLNSVIDEFLPYLVYIGLGLITSTIGFIAVRWLIGRTSSKVRGTFSSGKRKR